MMEKKPLRKADFITSLILILFAIWVAVRTITTFPMKDTYAGVQNVWYVSPALFPLLISTGLFVLGIVLLIHSIRTQGAATFLREVARAKPGISENVLRFLSIVLLLVVYVYLHIPRIDFFLSSLICLTVFITMYYLDYPGLLPRLTIFYTVGSLVFVLLFAVGVDVTLNRAVTEAVIERVVVSFQDQAFASSAANDVKDAARDLYLNFNDPTLFYSDNRFKEADANDGSIETEEPVIITLSGGAFSGEDGEEFVAAGKVTTTIDNVASGLTPDIRRVSPTELEVTLSGQAQQHQNADDVEGLTFIFQDSAFTSGEARKFRNFQKQDLRINFKDPLLTYSAKSFKEAPANDGSIDNSPPLTITLSGAVWSGADGDDFLADDKVQTNLKRMAPGLTMVVTRTSPQEVQVTLTGTADQHADANDVKELMLRFKNQAFAETQADTVKDYYKADLMIDFADTQLTYSADGFEEDAANDGTIDNTPPLTITLSGDRLSGADGDDLAADGKIQTNIEQVAPGLSMAATRTSATTVEVALTGTAASHDDAADVESLTLTFTDAAFASGSAAGVIAAARSDLQINFIEQALRYSTETFCEAEANDGTIDNSEPVTIQVNADTLTGTDGEDFVETGKVETNLADAAPGLTPVVTRTSATELQVALTGQTGEHASINDVDNLTFRFTDAAFVSGDAAALTNAVKDDLRIEFRDPALIYSKKLLKEAEANDGSLDNSEPLIITLTGDIWTGENGENFVETGKVVTNIDEVMPGLSVTITRLNQTEVQVLFQGAAQHHQREHGIENLTLTFQDEAFTDSEAMSVEHWSLKDLRVNFSNPVLSYSGMEFRERGNDGSIDNSEPVTLTLTGDTLSGDQGEDFVATGKIATNIANVAPDLQMSAIRQSPTELHLTLTGQANSHANADDVKRLSCVFQDSAFTSCDARIVVNAEKHKLKIVFTDLALSYSKSGFKEAAANDGTIDNSKPLIVTLSGDQFTGEDGQDLAAADKVRTNLDEVAPGLSAVATRLTPTEVEVTLKGAARQHTNANDVFMGGPFRYSMDILLLLFFLLYLWYCWTLVRGLPNEEARAKFLLAMVVSIAMPVFVVPLFKYALLVPFPVEGGGIEIMNLFWYAPAIRAIRRVIGRYLLLLGIDLIFVAIIVGIYFKFMRKPQQTHA
jgi:hypothetical protein